MILFIDFETRSELDVGSVGTHKYAMHHSTQVTLVSWAIDGNSVMTSTEVDDHLYELIENPSVLKIAHNAEFDMAICRYVLGINIYPESWFDTAYQAAYFGYPRKLSHLAGVLKTQLKASPEEMLLFATPLAVRRPKQSDELFAREEPARWATKETHPAEWERFVLYSATDVEVMRECYRKMSPLPPIEQFTMQFTFAMNFEGVPFDLFFAKQIKHIADVYASEAGREAYEKYGVSNLRSVKQVQDALYKNGVFLTSLNKKERAGVEHPLLDLRDQASGAAFSKVKTAEERICYDNRLRGEFVGFGAHTGRWSSRGVQLQNFARILSEVSTDLSKVRSYDHLRQHLRLCIHAPKPYQFVCADLSQIEARIVAWLANCEWRMKAFANDEDIYSRSAERMFGLPHVDKSMPERQMGKCAELGLGYGGGSNAINRIAPDFYREQGEAKIDDIVRRWRNANPEICQLWRDIERAFKNAMAKGVCKMACGSTNLVFRFDGKTASIELPSRRCLYYRGVHTDNADLYYLDYSRGGEYAVRTKFWGGVLLENITQAIARDVLVDIMYRVKWSYAGLTCIGSVHDEVWYLSAREDALDILLDAMSKPIKWATGLVTKGDGFMYDRYIK